MLEGESIGLGAEDEEASGGPQQRRGSRSTRDQNLQLKAKRKSAMRGKDWKRNPETGAFSTG